MFDDNTINQLAKKLATLLNQPKPELTHRLMDVEEAATYLGMSETALRQRKSKGQVPASVTKRIGRSTYYDRLRMDEWLDSMEDAA